MSSISSRKLRKRRVSKTGEGRGLKLTGFNVCQHFTALQRYGTTLMNPARYTPRRVARHVQSYVDFHDAALTVSQTSSVSLSLSLSLLL